MKIKSNIVLTLSAFAGLVGAVLRKVEYNTALNGGAGIAEESFGCYNCAYHTYCGGDRVCRRCGSCA